jgi:hypothetical protein
MVSQFCRIALGCPDSRPVSRSAHYNPGQEASVFSELALLPSGRTVRRWDVAIPAYVAVFAILGVVAGTRLWALAELQQGLLEAGQALDEAARAIGLLGQVPVIGDGADQLAGSVRETSLAIRTSAAAAAADIRALAVVVGVAVALVPVVPVLVLYLPLRLARARELRGLRRLLVGAIDPALVEHLARAALRRVPYTELRRISDKPWQEVQQGRHAALAAAELRRLGLRPPPDWLPGASRPQRG